MLKNTFIAIAAATTLSTQTLASELILSIDQQPTAAVLDLNNTADPSTSKPQKNWSITYTPYIWAAGIKTTAELGGLPGMESDLAFKDVIDKADMAYMHNLEFRMGQWGLMNEIIYFDLSDSSEPDGKLVDKIEAGASEGIYDLAVTFNPKTSENTQFILGVRRVDVELVLDIQSLANNIGNKRSLDKTWDNLLIGMKQEVPIDANWKLGFKADYAGNLSDEDVFILTADANYTMNDLMDLRFGYRYASMHVASEEISIDQSAAGSFLGLAFNW
ncbi:MAG: hypothetical protein HRU20_18610 [Pseudomonadales bacterium]|nr:hypothetical protein [Pseudomonadales bacterium]